MKIGVNGRFLTKPFTGIGRYSRYLFEEIARQNPEDEIVMAANSNVSFKMPQNVRVVVIPENFPGTSGMKKTYWEQFQLENFFNRQKVDLVHFPYPCNFWKGYHKPVCVTVHDTIPWTMPLYRKSLSTRLYQDRCMNAVKKADHVFAVSESAKKEIIEICSLDPKKTSVSYNALPDIFFQTVGKREKEEVLIKNGIPVDEPYLLYVGGYDVRKNVDVLTSAYIRNIAVNYALNLVMVGGKHLNDKLYQSFDNLTNNSSGDRLQMKGKILTTGFVEDKDLPALYQSAFAFVNLSAKEGFNLPLLEAAVSGTPIMISDLPVHHEVAGEYGIYVRYDNPAQVAHTIKKLLTDPDFYQKQKQKMADFSCPFSWEETAGSVMNIYKTLL